MMPISDQPKRRSRSFRPTSPEEQARLEHFKKTMSSNKLVDDEDEDEHHNGGENTSGHFESLTNDFDGHFDGPLRTVGKHRSFAKSQITVVRSFPDRVRASSTNLSSSYLKSGIPTSSSIPRRSAFIEKYTHLKKMFRVDSKNLTTPEKLVKAMSEKMYNEGFMVTATQSFTSLCESPQNVVELLRLGGLELLITVVQKHSANPTIAEQCFDSFNMLISKNERARERLSEIDGAQTIIKICNKFTGIAAIHQRALPLLCILTLNQKSREILAQKKCLNTVIKIMHLYEEVPSIQSDGCTLLGNIAYGSQSTKMAIGRLGGIEATIDAMRLHLDNPLVQMRACLALRNMSWDMKENRLAIGSAGGVKTLLTALSRYIDSPAVMQQSLVALCNVVVEDEQNQAKFDQDGGFEITLSCLKSNLHDTIIQEHSIALLYNNMFHDGFIQNEFLEADGVEFLIKSISFHTNHQGVLEKALELLKLLCPNPHVQKRITQCGGILVLADAVAAVVDSLDKR